MLGGRKELWEEEESLSPGDVGGDSCDHRSGREGPGGQVNLDELVENLPS